MKLQLIRTTFWGVVALVAVGLAGLIGYYQGFARTVGINDLERSIPALLADGVLMVRDVPGHVFQAGLSGTGEWMLATASAIAAAGLLALALLAGGMSDLASSSEEPNAGRRGSTKDSTSRLRSRPESPPVRPATSTRPRMHAENSDATGEVPSSPATIMVGLGFSIALIAAIVHFGWTISRHRRLGEMSIFDPGVDLDTWIHSARVAAGIDVIALAACVIWLLFALRLRRILGWLKILTVTASGCAVALGFAAASVSVGSLTQVNLKRPAATVGQISPEPALESARAGTGDYGLLLGRSATHLIILRDNGKPLFIPSNQTLEVQSRATLSEFLKSTRLEPRSSTGQPANGGDSESDVTMQASDDPAGP